MDDPREEGGDDARVLDDDDDDSDQEEFEEAAELLRNLVACNQDISRSHRAETLQLYGCYKRVTEGLCEQNRPSLLRGPAARAKWAAWKQRDGMSRAEARMEYVKGVKDLMNQLNISYQQRPRRQCMGVRVSVMSYSPEHQQQQDQHCSIIDEQQKAAEQEMSACSRLCRLAKTGDLAQLKLFLQQQHREDGGVSPWTLDDLDEQGLSALHWAADRGHAEVICWLLDEGGVKINLQDSQNKQTALHQAVCACHHDVVECLLVRGADVEVRDVDGFSALDLCDDGRIKNMLLQAGLQQAHADVEDNSR